MDRTDDRTDDRDVTLDDSDWPVLRIIFPPALDAPGLDRYLRGLRAICERGEKFWCLVDLRVIDVTKARPAMRKQLSEAVDALHDEFPGLVQCEACFTESSVVRLFHTAHSWLRRNMPYPSRIFSSEEEARGWIEELRLEANR